MIRHAFTMKLRPGCENEYRKRHDEIWPQLTKLLHDAGIRDYTIWLEPGTGTLFALMHLLDNHTLATLPDQPIMKQWWDYMADLMDVHQDNSPVTKDLAVVFHQD